MPEDVNTSAAEVTDEPLVAPDEGAETEAPSAEEGGEPDEAPDGREAETGDEDEGDEGEVREKFDRLQRDYQRLERKFTKVSQQAAEAQQAMETYRFIASRPELAEQVNRLIEAYAGTPAAVPEAPAVDLATEREAMRDLLSRPDFAKYEEEIAEFAEESGLPFESAVDQRTAYLLWRGVNADRLVQEARMEAAKKAARAQQARSKAGLQRAGGPGKPPAPDYKKMSDEEVLASLGLSLFTDD